MESTVQKNITQEEIIQMMQDFNMPDWAKTSRFYQEVMADGNIYNPYIHRRFLPYQFKQLCRRAANNEGWVTKERLLYASHQRWLVDSLIQYVADEISLLAYLQKRDPLAFRERSTIWNLTACKEGLLDYLSKIQESAVSRKERTADVYIDRRWLYKTSELVYALDKQIKEVSGASSYSELSAAISHCYTFTKNNRTTVVSLNAINLTKLLSWFYIPTVRESCLKLYNTFLTNGAYYTYKHFLMFAPKVKHRGIQLKELEASLYNGDEIQIFTGAVNNGGFKYQP